MTYSTLTYFERVLDLFGGGCVGDEGCDEATARRFPAALEVITAAVAVGTLAWIGLGCGTRPVTSLAPDFSTGGQSAVEEHY